jgi:hypothetical protein
MLVRMTRTSMGWGLVALAVGALGLGCSDAATVVTTDGGVTADGSGTDATASDGGTGDSGADVVSPDGAAALPKGWLYTQGNKVYVANGSGGGSVWVGRGVNMDDIFFCGYDNTLWMSNPGQSLTTLATNLVTTWKPTFVRISLSMNSYPTKPSWTANPAQYKTPMTAVINAIGQNPGVYVLVALRSDVSMVMEDMLSGDPEATGVPSNATDATYVALVDTFANSSFVVFGLSNEPGGDQVQTSVITAAMEHAVGVIRAEENKLGVPHHLVSVQGNNWTSDISAYAAKPLPYDNVVYEVHGYPPLPSSYTYANLPVIIGEYGTLANATTFFADLEAKQIPNLAWDFEPYSDCTPDLLLVNQSSTNLTLTAWGTTVKAYLLAH